MESSNYPQLYADVVSAPSAFNPELGITNCVRCQEKIEYKSDYSSPMVSFACGHHAHYRCCKEWIMDNFASCIDCKLKRDQQKIEQAPPSTITASSNKKFTLEDLLKDNDNDEPSFSISDEKSMKKYYKKQKFIEDRYKVLCFSQRHQLLKKVTYNIPKISNITIDFDLLMEYHLTFDDLCNAKIHIQTIYFKMGIENYEHLIQLQLAKKHLKCANLEGDDYLIPIADLCRLYGITHETLTISPFHLKLRHLIQFQLHSEDFERMKLGIQGLIKTWQLKRKDFMELQMKVGFSLKEWKEQLHLKPKHLQYFDITTKDCKLLNWKELHFKEFMDSNKEEEEEKAK